MNEIKRLSWGDFSKQIDLRKYPDDVLEATLCTSDGVGVENKMEILQEIIDRKIDEFIDNMEAGKRIMEEK